MGSVCEVLVMQAWQPAFCSPTSWENCVQKNMILVPVLGVRNRDTETRRPDTLVSLHALCSVRDSVSKEARGLLGLHNRLKALLDKSYDLSSISRTILLNVKTDSPKLSSEVHVNHSVPHPPHHT